MGFKRINIFLLIKLVSCLFNIPGGHSDVDASAGSAVVASCFQLLSAPGRIVAVHMALAVNRRRVREVHLQERQLA